MRANTTYGLNVYDYIVLDGSVVSDDQIITNIKKTDTNKTDSTAVPIETTPEEPVPEDTQPENTVSGDMVPENSPVPEG